VEEDEDTPVPATVKEAYFNQQRKLMIHIKVASEKNKVKWV
jgi:hypothetical protein